MKNPLLKIAICLLLLPIFSYADLPGGGVHWHTAFEITNTNKFSDYSFYYSYDGHTNDVKEGKTYSFSHPGSPSVDWNISVYAKNNHSGKSTATFQVGSNSNKELIQILEIKNDSIYFQKTTSEYHGESNTTVIPTNDNPENVPVVAIEGISTMTLSLIGISAISLAIFGLVIYLRTRKIKNA